MEATKKTNVSTEPIADGEYKNSAPRKLTLAENVVLTAKVLAVAGLILAALWGVNTWTAVR